MDLTVYDALTGDTKKPEYTHRDGQTRAVWGLGVHDSLLMRLTPAVQSRYGRETIADKKETGLQDPAFAAFGGHPPGTQCVPS